MGKSLTEAECETVNGISPTGLHIDSGRPCDCGPEPYSTTKKRAFSDSMVYKHHCTECGNRFTTWTEG